MDKITKEQVREVARQIAAEHPNAVNPLGPHGGCLYTKREDDTNDDTAEHCFGGELLLRFGAELPEEVDRVQHTPDAEMFEDSALTYLEVIQMTADNFSLGRSRPRKWSEVINLVRF